MPQNQEAAAKTVAVAKQQQDGKVSKAQLKQKQVAMVNLLRHPEENSRDRLLSEPMNLSSPRCDIVIMVL